MHKGLEFSSLPLEVENPYGNSLTVFPSFENEDFDFQEGLSPFDDDPPSDSSQYQTCSESWEDFHSLSPFGADWEMEQEFFKPDLSDLECKPQGPTLAELNNQRSTSPLINPEMERLHRIATRTETEGTSSTGTGPQHEMKTTTDGQGMLQRNTENQCSSFITNDAEMSSKASACDEKGTKSNSGPEIRTRDVTSTITVKQEPTETIELNMSKELMRKIALLEAKSNSSKTSVSVPQEVVIYVSKSEDELAVIQEESGDEDVDSEDEFEDIIRSGDGETAAKQRKGRRGDTEDLNPNPRRLLEIGRELNRLTKIITDLKPIHSLPMNARNKSKKEKNKLASRACRLKKKAQHESNKLKLHGLELEHQRLISLIGKVKTQIVHDTQGYTVTGDLSNTVEHLIHNTLGDQVIAGHTTAFVESVLKATASATPGCENMDIQFNI